MTIYIISNEPRTIRFLTGAVSAYSNQKYVPIETKVFRKSREYLADFSRPDMVFVDDNIDMKPSVETARLIRSRDGKAAIVLLSSSPERVFEAFSVKPLRFLSKPVTQADIFEAIDAYRKELFTYRVIIAKVQDSFRIFTSEEIYALIADGNHTRLVTKDEEVEILTPFTKVEIQLPEEYFFKCHRAYMVNMKHIAKFDTDEIELTNRLVVPISRRRKLEFTRRYAQFVKGHTFQ